MRRFQGFLSRTFSGNARAASRLFFRSTGICSSFPASPSTPASVCFTSNSFQRKNIENFIAYQIFHIRTGKSLCSPTQSICTYANSAFPDSENIRCKSANCGKCHCETTPFATGLTGATFSSFFHFSFPFSILPKQILHPFSCFFRFLFFISAMFCSDLKLRSVSFISPAFLQFRRASFRQRQQLF